MPSPPISDRAAGCCDIQSWPNNLAKFCQNAYTDDHKHDEHFAARYAEGVRGQVAGRGYSTSSEYVRELIRKDQDRQRLRRLLLDGAESAPGTPADDAYFKGLSARARRTA